METFGESETVLFGKDEAPAKGEEVRVSDSSATTRLKQWLALSLVSIIQACLFRCALAAR